MIELHCHSTLSNGALSPAALLRQAKVRGYRAIALTDHADVSTLEVVLSATMSLTEKYSLYADITAIPGIELCHVPPALLHDAIKEARELGAKLVLVHGEDILDTVVQGTNLAAILAGADILAHPGLLTKEEATLAAERGTLLEISCSPQRGLCNGLIAQRALAAKASYYIGGDVHAASDLYPAALRQAVALGAGLSKQSYMEQVRMVQALVGKLIR